MNRPARKLLGSWPRARTLALSFTAISVVSALAGIWLSEPKFLQSLVVTSIVALIGYIGWAKETVD